jgi:hypothetical protein
MHLYARKTPSSFSSAARCITARKVSTVIQMMHDSLSLKRVCRLSVGSESRHHYGVRHDNRALHINIMSLAPRRYVAFENPNVVLQHTASVRCFDFTPGGFDGSVTYSVYKPLGALVPNPLHSAIPVLSGVFPRNIIGFTYI